MRYEIKKLLLRKEVLIVAILSLITMVIFNMRDKWKSFEILKASQTETSKYFDMSIDEANEKIGQELEQLMSGDVSEASPDYAQWYILNTMQKSISEYKKLESDMSNRLRKMYDDLDHATTDFEKRDIEKAIKMYNRKTPYKPNNSWDLDFAFLNLDGEFSIQLLYLIIMCTLFAPLFSVETETGMYQLLYSSKKGKRGLFIKKISAAAVCTALIALAYTAVTFIIMWLKYGLSFKMLFAPIQCARSLQNCPFPISILTFFLMMAFMRFIIGMWIASLTALASCFFRKTIAVFGTITGITGVIFLISRTTLNIPSVQSFLKHLGLVQLTISSNFFAQYETVNVLGFPVEQIWLSVACTAALSYLLLAIAYAIYTTPAASKRKKVK